MASSNQPNGTSNVFIPRPPYIPQTAQATAKASVPVTGSQFHTVDSTSTTYDDAYTKSTAQGRSRPNAPFNGAIPTPTPQFPTWNAAALLNPRGFQKSHQQDERKANTPIRNGPPPSIAFQFDSPMGSTPPVRNVQSIRQNGGYMWPSEPAPGIAMGHMLERIHNVSERDFLPQKRRKIELEGEDDNAQKAHFGGGGKGGVLGEYMKEKQEQGRKEDAANGTRSSVDLTGGRSFLLGLQNTLANTFNRRQNR
jgi:hypothetical protein